MEAAATEAPVDTVPAGGEGAEPDVDSVIDAAAAEYDAGKTGEAPAEEPETQEATPSTEAKEEGQEAKPDETKEEESPEPFVQEPEPENLKKAFKSLGKYHPEVAKAVRNAYYENKAYKEIFTVPEARALKTYFSNVQQAESAKAAEADLLTVDQLLHESPQTLLGHIQQRDPQAYAGLTRAALDAISSDPSVYEESISKPAVNNYKDFYLRKAQETGDQELQAAIEIINDREARLFGTARQPATRQTNDPQLVARLQQLEAEREQAQESAIDSFKGSIDSSFQTFVNAEVDQILKRTGADLSPAGIEEIHDRVLADTLAGIQNDLALQRRLGWSARQGRRDSTHQKELIDLLSVNGRRFIPASTSKHLTWLTKEIVKASEKQVRKAEESAPAKAIRGATPGSASSSGKLISKSDLEKMTPDEIIKKAGEGYDFA